MKKILSLLSVLTIAGISAPTLTATSEYYSLDKQLEILTLKMEKLGHIKISLKAKLTELQSKITKLQNKLENTNLVKKLQEKVKILEQKKAKLEMELTELQHTITKLIITVY